MASRSLKTAMSTDRARRLLAKYESGSTWSINRIITWWFKGIGKDYVITVSVDIFAQYIYIYIFVDFAQGLLCAII